MSVFDPVDRLDLDPPEPPEFRLEGRCLYCLSRLPADQLCRCDDSLQDLEEARRG